MIDKHFIDVKRKAIFLSFEAPTEVQVNTKKQFTVIPTNTFHIYTNEVASYKLIIFNVDLVSSMYVDNFNNSYGIAT